jgi:hypothetical protein
MVTPLSDRQRWGISFGESLGHHNGNRDIGRRGDVILALGEVTGCFPFSGAPILRRA